LEGVIIESKNEIEQVLKQFRLISSCVADCVNEST